MAVFSFKGGKSMPEYIDLTTDDGHTLRIVYEMSIGDLVISSLLLLLLLFLVIRTILKILWR